MRRKIRIGKPYVEKTADEKYRLCAVLREDGKREYTAWYEVSAEYAPYLCTERSDAFVVALIPYAVRNDVDICCEQVVSERLFYQLNQYLLPTYGGSIKGFYRIGVEAETCDTVLPNKGARGASLSGGVDSFYTLLSHLNRKETNYNITHLTFFNVGASGDNGGEEARKLYHDRIKTVENVAQSLEIPLLCVDSNISEYLGLTHVSSHTYRTLSVVLALQKLFSSYFFASGYPYRKFMITSHDPAQFDLLNLQCLSTENLTFYLSGAEKSRQEKLAVISNHDITYNNLNVCFSSYANCSYCPKCRRTMMGLYLIGKLELYRQVFKVDWFLSSLNYQIADVCSYRKESDFQELYLELKRRHKVHLYHYVLGFLRSKLRKGINKEGFFRKFYLKIRPKLKK